jgi:hypothetical protein
VVGVMLVGLDSVVHRPLLRSAPPSALSAGMIGARCTAAGAGRRGRGRARTHCRNAGWATMATVDRDVRRDGAHHMDMIRRDIPWQDINARLLTRLPDRRNPD